MLKGHLSRVIYHQVCQYTKTKESGLSKTVRPKRPRHGLPTCSTLNPEPNPQSLNTCSIVGEGGQGVQEVCKKGVYVSLSPSLPPSLPPSLSRYRQPPPKRTDQIGLHTCCTLNPGWSKWGVRVLNPSLKPSAPAPSCSASLPPSPESHVVIDNLLVGIH